MRARAGGSFWGFNVLRDGGGLMRDICRRVDGKPVRPLRIAGVAFAFGRAGPVEAWDAPKHKAASRLDCHLKLQQVPPLRG